MEEKKCDENEINLRALRQMDASIAQILLTCGQCAVYKYSNSSNEWERKEIEGAMFVVYRNRPANYGFVVINRLNTTNMFQAIDHNFDINMTVPYLLYKNSLNEIFCIWFYNENDCKNFGQQLQQIIEKLKSQENCVHNPNDILKKLFTTQLDLNADDKAVQRHLPNGQPLTQSQTCDPKPIQPQKLSLQVQQLFQSVPMTLTPIKSQEFTAQTIEDSLLNDVITPAMLTQTHQSSKPNESLTQSQSPIVFSQPPQKSTPGYPHNYSANNSVPTLTMEQLKQTLIHLLQSDADFLHSIHSAYKKSIKK